jgi:hypothetical protein
MLIIAKKKDYYDGVVGTMGVDKTLVYNRETIEFENDDMPFPFKSKRGFWGVKHRENPFHELAYHSIKKEFKNVCDEHAHFVVGFCGKLYIGWKLYTGSPVYPYEVTTTITYDNEYIKTILEQKSWHGNLEDSINNVLNFDALQIFRDLKVPVFIYDGDYGRLYFDKKRYSYNNHHPKFFINPLLKDYEFYKVFDSFQAFQEVSMFMGGVLGNREKDIVVVEDKYKIAQHGFDKWSFRKMPEDGKGN